VDPSVEKNQKEKLLTEIKQLNSRLAATFNLKKTESKQLISRTRDEINKKTIEKKNTLLMHSQDLINKMDQIEEELDKMEKSSEIMFEKFNKETSAFEEKLNTTDVAELNSVAAKLKLSLSKKVDDFEKFDLGIKFEPSKDDGDKEKNSIGFITSAGPRVSRLLSSK
jgi:hypothetical protein